MSITEKALRESVAGGYRTLKDIGSDFGVTRERIRQLCNKYRIERHRPFSTLSASRQAVLSPRSRWPREGMPALKRRLGLCPYNGCFSPHAPDRARCPQHLQIVAANTLRYSHDHRQRGLCILCPDPAAPGHTRCQRHLDRLNSESHTRYRKAAA